MSIVKNLILEQHSISLKNTRYSALEKLIPKATDYTLSFELENSSCEFANALYRTVKGEIPVRYMTASMDEIFTNDDWMDKFIIRSRLEMIPIEQDIDFNDTFSLCVENNTDEILYVVSDDIKQRGVASKKILPSVLIGSLNPRTMLSINNISIVESQGYINGRSAIGCAGYEIIGEDFNNSILKASPSHFKLSFRVPKTIDPKQMVLDAIENICSRIRSIDLENSREEYGIFKLFIPNESHSIGFLMDKYIFKLNPNIEYVAKRDEHPSKRACTIDIKHPQAKQLCEGAIKHIITEYEAIKKAFK